MGLLYKVKSIVERMDITPKGEFVRMYEIAAVTKSGVDFTVLIPKLEFSKEKASKLLEEEAKKIEDTLAL